MAGCYGPGYWQVVFSSSSSLSIPLTLPSSSFFPLFCKPHPSVACLTFDPSLLSCLASRSSERRVPASGGRVTAAGAAKRSRAASSRTSSARIRVPSPQPPSSRKSRPSGTDRRLCGLTGPLSLRQRLQRRWMWRRERHCDNHGCTYMYLCRCKYFCENAAHRQKYILNLS